VVSASPMASMIGKKLKCFVFMMNSLCVGTFLKTSVSHSRLFFQICNCCVDRHRPPASDQNKKPLERFFALAVFVSDLVILDSQFVTMAPCKERPSAKT
jgi:hypothetical protein